MFLEKVNNMKPGEALPDREIYYRLRTLTPPQLRMLSHFVCPEHGGRHGRGKWIVLDALVRKGLLVFEPSPASGRPGRYVPAPRVAEIFKQLQQV